MKEPNNHEKDLDEKTDEDETEDKDTDNNKLMNSDTSGIDYNKLIIIETDNITSITRSPIEGDVILMIIYVETI